MINFFNANDECKAMVTAARLAYFDGDYRPSAAKDLIYIPNKSIRRWHREKEESNDQENNYQKGSKSFWTD